jgi:glycosyltransferase involved in cell wall biosynthesis
MSALAAARYDVIGAMPASPAGTAPPGVRHIRLPAVSKNFFPNSSGLYLISALRQRARNASVALWHMLWERPSVVFCHEPDSWSIGLILKWLTGALLLGSVHEVYEDRCSAFSPWLRKPAFYIVRRWLRFLAKRSDCVIHVSDYRREHYSFETARQVVIPQYPDGEAFDRIAPMELPSLAGKFVLVHGGPLRPSYAAQELLQAIQIAAKELPDLVCVAIGGTIGFGKRQEADLMGLVRQGRMIVLPPLPHDQVIGVLKGAQVGISLVLPVDATHRLASPRKLYEYIHAGLPVICADVPEARQILHTWECGLLVDATQPEDIVRAIKALAADTTLRDRMSRAARCASKSLDWQTVRPRLTQLLTELGAARQR